MTSAHRTSISAPKPVTGLGRAVARIVDTCARGKSATAGRALRMWCALAAPNLDPAQLARLALSRKCCLQLVCYLSRA